MSVLLRVKRNTYNRSNIFVYNTTEKSIKVAQTLNQCSAFGAISCVLLNLVFPLLFWEIIQNTSGESETALPNNYVSWTLIVINIYGMMYRDKSSTRIMKE